MILPAISHFDSCDKIKDGFWQSNCDFSLIFPSIFKAPQVLLASVPFYKKSELWLRNVSLNHRTKFLVFWHDVLQFVTRKITQVNFRFARIWRFMDHWTMSHITMGLSIFSFSSSSEIRPSCRDRFSFSQKSAEMCVYSDTPGGLKILTKLRTDANRTLHFFEGFFKTQDNWR